MPLAAPPKKKIATVRKSRTIDKAFNPTFAFIDPTCSSFVFAQFLYIQDRVDTLSFALGARSRWNTTPKPVGVTNWNLKVYHADRLIAQSITSDRTSFANDSVRNRWPVILVRLALTYLLLLRLVLILLCV